MEQNKPNRDDAVAARALDSSGDNLALINPDLFLENELLRLKISEQRNPPKTGFLTLAGELQDNIYAMVLGNEIRVIEICYTNPPRGFPVRASSLVPSLMHVCSRSRVAAKKVYSIFMRDCDFFRQSGFPITYINWKRDLVYFPEFDDILRARDSSILVIKHILEKCQNLAIELDDAGGMARISYAPFFHELKKLYLIKMEGDGYTGPIVIKEMEDDEVDSPRAQAWGLSAAHARNTAASITKVCKQKAVAWEECLAVNGERRTGFRHRTLAEMVVGDQKSVAAKKDASSSWASDALLAAQLSAEDSRDNAARREVRAQEEAKRQQQVEIDAAFAAELGREMNPNLFPVQLPPTKYAPYKHTAWVELHNVPRGPRAEQEYEGGDNKPYIYGTHGHWTEKTAAPPEKQGYATKHVNVSDQDAGEASTNAMRAFGPESMGDKYNGEASTSTEDPMLSSSKVHRKASPAPSEQSALSEFEMEEFDEEDFDEEEFEDEETEEQEFEEEEFGGEVSTTSKGKAPA